MISTEKLHLRVKIKNGKDMTDKKVRDVTESAIKIMKKYGMSEFSVEANFESHTLKYGADTLKLGKEDPQFFNDCTAFMEKYHLEGIKIYPDPDAPREPESMN